MFIQMLGSLFEHVPRCSGFRFVVTHIGIRKHYTEYDIRIFLFRHIHTARHGLTVYLLRNDLETPFRMNITCKFVFRLLQVKFPTGQHPTLENDSCCLSGYSVFRIIKTFGYCIIEDVVKVFFFIHNLYFSHFTDT